MFVEDGLGESWSAKRQDVGGGWERSAGRVVVGPATVAGCGLRAVLSGCRYGYHQGT